MTSCFGKYRGTVVDNVDPQRLGRIRAHVPAVSEETSAWAMPCVPFLSPTLESLVVPAIGAGVWLEYEGGDPDLPIWTGGFWTSPADVPAPGVVIRSQEGASLTVRSDVTITNAAGVSVELRGPAVDVNHGALLVL